MKKRATKKIIKAKILSNRNIAPDHYVMDIESPWLARNSKAGQFVNVKVQEGVTDPLLRIPLGVHRKHKTGIAVLYKTVGPGTELLARRRKGEVIDVLGPLGKGFDVSAVIAKKGHAAVIVAGGQGVAPLFALAEEILSKKKKVDFFFGARVGEHVVCEKDLKRLGAKVYVATEDGTCGKKGCVTDLLKEHLKRNTHDAQRTTIFACGPKPMLAVVAKEAARYGMPAQVTYDEYMACGIGACRGCAVETTEGIKMACEDGPVFDARVIKWEKI